MRSRALIHVTADGGTGRVQGHRMDLTHHNFLLFLSINKLDTSRVQRGEPASETKGSHVQLSTLPFFERKQVRRKRIIFAKNHAATHFGPTVGGMNNHLRLDQPVCCDDRQS